MQPIADSRGLRRSRRRGERRRGRRSGWGGAGSGTRGSSYREELTTQEQEAHRDRHWEQEEAVLRGCPDVSGRNHTWTFYSKVIFWKKMELTQATIGEAILHTGVSSS